jgi:hypothetical protein
VATAIAARAVTIEAGVVAIVGRAGTTADVGHAATIEAAVVAIAVDVMIAPHGRPAVARACRLTSRPR